MEHAHDEACAAPVQTKREPAQNEKTGRAFRAPYATTPASMLELQRLAGNAAVATLQREVTVDEMTVEAASPEPQSAPGGAPGGMPGAPATLGDGGPVSINGTPVTINGGLVTADGVLRAQTIMADSVIASSYSPGAGNVW